MFKIHKALLSILILSGLTVQTTQPIDLGWLNTSSVYEQGRQLCSQVQTQAYQACAPVGSWLFNNIKEHKSGIAGCLAVSAGIITAYYHYAQHLKKQQSRAQMLQNSQKEEEDKKEHKRKKEEQEKQANLQREQECNQQEKNIHQLQDRVQEINDAIRRNDIPTLQELIEKNPDLLNRWDSTCQAPLHIAASDGENVSQALPMLINAGAQLNIPNRQGQTPLHVAIANNKFYTAAKLIKKGACVDKQDKQGKTPLHYALSIPTQLSIHSTLVYTCICQSNDLNLQDKDGNTPLHSAALIGNKKYYALLVQAGADANTRNKFGCRPQDI